jgi:lipopolysaccharide transport system ATP-binding protein
MAAIKSLCGRCVLLSDGSKLFEGSTVDAIDKYLDSISVRSEKDIKGFISLENIDNENRKNKIIKKIRLTDKEGACNNNFLMGRDLKIEVIFDGLKEYNAQFGIMIKDNNGQVITSIGSGMIDVVYNNNRSMLEKAIVTLPNIQLIPGKYFVDISVAQKNIGRIDFVENSINFNIEADDVYDSGFHFSNHFGVFYIINPNIELNNSSD